MPVDNFFYNTTYYIYLTHMQKYINITLLIIVFLLLTQTTILIYDKYQLSKCIKQYSGSKFVQCFDYQRTEPETTAQNKLQEKVSDPNCYYTIPDSKAGEFQVKCEHIYKIVDAFGKDTTLIAIIFQESGFKPLAKNVNKDGTVDRGIFQLNSKYWTIKEGDIDHSIQQAKQCKKENGYNCWVAYWSKDYKNYLDEANHLLSIINK